jgi:hypothetical protein
LTDARVTVTTTAHPQSTSDEEDTMTPSSSASDASEERELRARSTAPEVSPKLPRIVRPAALQRAARPAEIPFPEHHHLPGWVRRIHGQARPVLADIAGGLDGEVRDRYETAVRDLIAAISSGKFSLAWQYPRLIEDGMGLYVRNRRNSEEAARARRTLENARRRASDALRDGAGRLAPDAMTRLQRTLQAAADVEAIRAVEVEINQATSAARTVAEKRREREIDRTRQRIRRALPGQTTEAAPTESWQDVLRRIAGQYSE